MIEPIRGASFICSEVPRHRKKSARKPPKKADHAHEYEPVILSYIEPCGALSPERGFVPLRTYHAGSRCIHCGRLIRTFPDGESPYVVRRCSAPWPNGEVKKWHELLQDFRHLEVVKVRDLITLKKEEDTYA